MAEKQARINAKQALTKQMNRIRQSLAEDELKSYDGKVRKLKDLFKEFTVAWEEYHDTLATEAEVEDAYFNKEQDCYIKILEMVKLGTHLKRCDATHFYQRPRKLLMFFNVSEHTIGITPCHVTRQNLAKPRWAFLSRTSHCRLSM